MAKRKTKKDLQEIIDDLKERIRVLIEEPNSVNAKQIKAVYHIQKSMEKAVWSGSTGVSCERKLTGIYILKVIP